MAPKKKKIFQPLVLRGREAIHNLAIFWILLESPQTQANIWKLLIKQNQMLIHFASLTKRIHCLDLTGYLERKENKKGEMPSNIVPYQIKSKAVLAMVLGSIYSEDLLDKASDKDCLILSIVLLNIILKHQELWPELSFIAIPGKLPEDCLKLFLSWLQNSQ
jgi:hypothetical protein